MRIYGGGMGFTNFHIFSVPSHLTKKGGHLVCIVFPFTETERCARMTGNAVWRLKPKVIYMHIPVPKEAKKTVKI